MSLLLLFAYPNAASIPIAELVETAPSASNGYEIQRPASSGAWRWVVELADPADGDSAIWRDVTAYYVGDRHQFGADTYLGFARARLISVQLQIDDSDMLAPWGQDTSSIFGTDVRLDAGMLMRASMTRIVGGDVEEWEPIWTGRVESWGDESGARGQVRRHVVNVVDTIADLANVPTIVGDPAATYAEWFEVQMLGGAGWMFGVDMYGDLTEISGMPSDPVAQPAVNRMDAATIPLGLVWRSLRSGKLVLHPAPWDTTNTERYDNPLLDVYPDGLKFNYSPDFTDIEYIADDDQQPFGIERNVAGIINALYVTRPTDADPEVYAIDDPVSIGRYGVRPYTATWIIPNDQAVDDILAARAFSSSQALPLRTTLDLEGFWSALAIVDHLDPVTVVHATSDIGLVVTATGTIRNIVEERTFRGEAGGDYALSWQSTVQIDLDATETASALLPVEDLAVVDTQSPLLGTSSWAEFSWTNPVQPSVTPTEVQMRITQRSFIWFAEDYAGVGADGTTIGALDAGTFYTFQVRLIRRENGVIVAASAIREVDFTTPYRIYPVPVEGETPDDTNVDMDDLPFEDCEDDVSIELQEQTEVGGAWVTVDTFSGAEIYIGTDGLWHLTDDIPNSFFNDGSMYRLLGFCGDDLIIIGQPFDPPDDWTDPCTTPPALSDPPFNDPSLLVYVPMVCAPDTIKEAVSGLVATHGAALAGIGSLLSDPDARALLAIADPDWSAAPGGILAYGECPQIVGHVADKMVTVKVNVADAAFCVLFECAAMRITCTSSGAGWKAGGYVVSPTGDQSCLSAELDLDTVYVINATYEQTTGTLRLYVDGLEVNSVSFGAARNTVAALPIWRVGAPPESWITDCAMFGSLIMENPVLDGLIHWWDASLSTITQSGGRIINVEDLIGSSDLIPISGLNGPVVGTLNGHTVMESFSVRGDSGNTATGLKADIPDVPQTWSFVVVYARRNTGLAGPGGGGPFNGTGTPFDLRVAGGGADFNNPWGLVDAAGVQIIANAVNTNTGAIPAFNTVSVIGLIANGASSEIWIDGVLDSTVNFGTDQLKIVQLFNTFNTANGNDLYIMEAQCAPGAEPNMASLSAALLAKWS